jgi:putative hydrolase of HD superfamily
MNKEKNIVNFYVTCNKLKNIIRTGWKDWNVKKERIESIAEHVYGTQMLALAVYSEYNYNIDIVRVIYMLAVHELGETIIGDYNPFEISKEEKLKIEHEAIHNILKDLAKGIDVEKLLLEFDDKSTPEANFAYMCDKMECDIQCKLYDEAGCVDVNNPEVFNNLSDIEKSLVKDGQSWSELWLKYDQEHCGYDENFISISNYLLENDISENE